MSGPTLEDRLNHFIELLAEAEREYAAGVPYPDPTGGSWPDKIAGSSVVSLKPARSSPTSSFPVGSDTLRRENPQIHSLFMPGTLRPSTA
jgi:hypothetical protein